MSGSPFWKKKEFVEYQRKLESELPPYYDFAQVRPTHQEIEAAVIAYWETLHPIIQDYVTSWWRLWSTAKKEIEKLVVERDQKASMLSNYKNSAESKIKDLAGKLTTKESELKIINQDVQQREQKIIELEKKDKQDRLGITELRAELEKQLAELNLKLSESQTRFNTTKALVNRAFENKIMIFESEVISLKEQVTTQEQKIQQLDTENQKLESENQFLKILEEKVGKIIDIVTSISFKEE